MILITQNLKGTSNDGIHVWMQKNTVFHNTGYIETVTINKGLSITWCSMLVKQTALTTIVHSTELNSETFMQRI